MFHTLPYILKTLLVLTLLGVIINHPIRGQASVKHIIAKDTIEIAPAEILTLSFLVINPSSETSVAHITPILPKGWNWLIKNDSVKFDKNEKKTVLQHVYIKSAILADVYDIGFEVNFPNSKYKYIFPCRVTEINKVALNFGEIPSFIKAGDSIKTTLHILNKGNVKKDFWVTITGLDGKDQKHQVNIAPSSSAIINIEEISNKNVERQSNKYLRASISLLPNQQPLAFASTSTHVIPKKEKPYDRYLRVPSYVGISYFGKHRNKTFETGWQAEAYGRGHLDESKLHAIEYRLRGPDRYYITSMGNYEEFFLKYKGPKQELIVGDNTYQLSLLTEFARYGRGVHLSTKIDKVTFGGFYMKPRFYPELKREIALFTEYNFSENHKIRANYLQKRFNHTADNVHIFSIAGSFKPLKETTFDFEYAVSDFKTKDNAAYYGKFSTNYFKNIIATGYFVYADKDYAGYYNNSIHYGGNATYYFNKKWYVNLGISKTSYNAALDTLFTQAPTRQNNYIGINYNPNRVHNYSLQGGYRSGKDRMHVKRYSYKEYFGRVNHHFRKEKIQLYSTIELSKTINLLLNNKKGNSWRQYASGNINYKINSNLNIGAFASYSRHNRYTEETKNYLYAGMSANLSFAAKTRLLLRVQNSFSIEDDYRDRSYFNLNFSHFFSPKHELVINNRYALPRKYTKDAIWEFGLQYRFHFGLPVGRKSKRLTSLKGIIDTNNEQHIPRNDILLHMSGKTVYSDKNGEFEFKNIPPGEHLLLIDKSQMAMNVIANTPEPIKVTLKTTEKNFIPIKLLKASELRGQLIIQEKEEKSEGTLNSSKAVKSLNNTPTVPPVVVELYNGDISYKRITDENGAFIFQQVIPGNWKLKIYPEGLLKNYELKKQEFDIKLKSDKVKSIKIPITPKQINIKFKSVKSNLVMTIK